MNEQLVMKDLFVDALPAANDNRKPVNELEAKWQQFHNENPHVFALIEKYAMEAIKAGYQHYAIKTLIERVRWHTDMETNDGEFKLSNNHAPYYARLFHRLYPEYAGFFRTHKVKGEAA